ncbi:MAG: cupin domain-containing protein [Alphaproteobacteria bacterium]|nr:cupin domain-containing protein [Alphaproteobacteria bacterium]
MENQTPMTETQNLKQMLSFQTGAVVSRMLVKNSSGNVTLFAFDEGEGLSEHTAPFDALVIGVEGQAEISIKDKRQILNEGETLLLPANIPHAVVPQGKFKMLLIMIRDEAKSTT